MQKKTIHKKVLNRIIQQVIRVAHPESIILFGSAARGEMGSHSDIDILVIKKGVYNSREVAANIYLSLYGTDQSVDVIVVSPEQVEKYKNSPYLVIGPALREGLEIYNAGTATAG
jgi:predicted nucleotidyltransferase